MDGKVKAPVVEPDDGLLGKLLEAAPPAVQVSAVTTDVSRPRKSAVRTATAANTSYDRWTRRFGLVAALIVVAALWGVGAYFTLLFLKSIGLRLAGAGLIGYSIPLLITVLEIGLQPGRSPDSMSRTIWLAILLLDAATTAAGIMELGSGSLDLGIARLTGWTLAGAAFGAGIFLALFPERAGRSLWVELRKNLGR